MQRFTLFFADSGFDAVTIFIVIEHDIIEIHML